MQQKTKRSHKKPIKSKKKQHTLLKVGMAVVGVPLLVGTSILSSYLGLRVADLPEPPLKELAAKHGIELGIHAAPDRLDHGPYNQLVTSQFSLLTSDGEIHWDKFRPTSSTYDFSKMDAVVAYAQKHNMLVQAHHLVWNEDDSLPKWLKEGNYSKKELLEFMEAHIKTVVGRYKGRVHEWSVVNEPFTRERHMYDLDNWWGDHLKGTNYIDKAFRWAHAADPKAKLILNDFNNDTKTFASDAQYEYMKGAKARGVPIDGVGMQLHVDARRIPTKEGMVQNMRRFADLGYPTYMTEFDMSTVRAKGDPENRDELEAQIAGVVAEACVEAGSCVSFTVFGLTDRNYFSQRFEIGRQRQYLFTSRYQPKAAFDAFRAALK